MTPPAGHAGRGWLAGRALLAFLGFFAIGVFLLLSGHRAHFLGFLPWLLLLACPLMHVFMHHGHGAHAGSADGGGQSSGPESYRHEVKRETS